MEEKKKQMEEKKKQMEEVDKIKYLAYQSLNFNK